MRSPYNLFVSFAQPLLVITILRSVHLLYGQSPIRLHAAQLCVSGSPPLKPSHTRLFDHVACRVLTRAVFFFLPFANLGASWQDCVQC